MSEMMGADFLVDEHVDCLLLPGALDPSGRVMGYRALLASQSKLPERLRNE